MHMQRTFTPSDFVLFPQMKYRMVKVYFSFHPTGSPITNYTDMSGFKLTGCFLNRSE